MARLTQQRVVGAGLVLCLAVSVAPLRAASGPLERLPPAPPPTEAARGEGYINFSFNEVDVPAFVKLVGEITGRQFVVGEDVKGKITVVSPRVNRSDVYPLFVSILESAGCSIVEDGTIYRVVPLPSRRAPLAPVIGADEETPTRGIVTKIFRLEHVSAEQVRQLLESQVTGKDGAVGAIEETRHLVVTDTAEGIRRIEKIVSEIDQPGPERVTEVVPVEFVGAEDLADQLNLALAESETRADRLRRRLPAVPGRSSASSGGEGPAVVASRHANSLLLVGTARDVAQLRQLVTKMDMDAPAGRGRLNAIFLKYLSAEEAAKNINALLMKSAAAPKGAGTTRSIAIEADVANNALLVDASPGDFDVVKELVTQLDRMPEQVHITVVIAEVTKTDSFNLGVEMAALDAPSSVGETVFQGASTLQDGADTLMAAVSQGVLPGGITVGLAYGTRVDADGRVVPSYPGIFNLDAVRKDSRFQVLSETSLEAQNNREASVNIVNQIPILKSTISGGSGTARDVIQNIDRIDVGIKLKLTPHIIPGGEVRMDLNPSIEAVIDPGPEGSMFAPTIARRDVQTTVTVPDGRMIVIAGLTRNDETKVDRRVPILGSIPLLGLLFRQTVDSSEKTDLLIFVTPRIVTDVVDAEDVKQEWRRKTGLDPDDEP